MTCESSEQKVCTDYDFSLPSSPDLNLENMFCVPESAQCPLTGMIYASGARSLDQPSVLARENSIGPPIVDVRYSQGQPCIIEGETNVVEGKQDYRLMTEEWYTGCDTSVESYTVSQMYEPVQNYPQFSDYDIIEDNDLLDTFDLLVAFDLKNLKDYKHDLYVKRYHSWKPSCSEDEVTPKATKSAVESASRVDNAVRWYFGLLATQVVLILIGLTANFMYREKALPKRPNQIVTKVRFLCSTLCGIGILASLLVIHRVIGNDVIAYLAEVDCTTDPVFEATFETIQAYLDDATLRFWISMVFLLVLIVLDSLQVYTYLNGLETEDDDFYRS